MKASGLIFSVSTLVFVGVLHAPANAQTTSTTKATATITATSPSLSIYSEQDLSFGPVSKPNGTMQGHFCRYQLKRSAASAWYSQTLVEELDANLGLVSIGSPSPSGCGFGDIGIDNSKFGRVLVQCEPGLTVTLSANYTGTNLAGVEFSAPSSLPSMIVDDEANDVVSDLTNSPVGTVYCKSEFDEGGPTSGFYMQLSGQLTLSEEAATASQVTVGSITLDASY